MITHLVQEELESGLEEIRQSPKNSGCLHQIVIRPDVDQREVLDIGELHVEHGLVGDNWISRKSSRMTNGFAHPDMQLNIMNSRAISLIAQKKDRWKLAGDQLFIDLDLSNENVPAGSQLKIGSAIIEVTEIPHTGCKKFVSRFGLDAMKFVNSSVGRELNLRGINAKVVKSGQIKLGDIVERVAT